jgi:hypothetical protein
MTRRTKRWIGIVAAAAFGATLAGAGLRCSEGNEPQVEPAAGKQASRFEIGNEYLFRLQALLRPVLETNRKEFTGRLGSIQGFGAGDIYPQIWLRDSSTLIGTSRYYYRITYLKSWLEEHLTCQSEEGRLYDWIAPGPVQHFLPHAPQATPVHSQPQLEVSADRNTVESDQESAAVSAAHQVFQITGDRDWLTRAIDGKPLIERLEGALTFLWDQALDSNSGLIVSGFTADWGDVSPVHADARAVYLDDETPRVVGLYTNAQFYQAARGLSELFGALDRADRAGTWQDRAESVRAGINHHLWQPDKGFYRMHRVVTPHLVQGWPDDTDIFAMGGNALAALYGIADEDQAQSIFRVAHERQEAFGLSTISGVLLPPFPKDFFIHPMMREPYQYQNGGQWDWFGGRLVLAEFERGRAELAYRQLVEIAKKAAESNGLFEWHTREGRGRGSFNYAGSAGALGEACFRGLFGVYLNANRLDIRVRLGARSGQIEIVEPATDTRVHYQYHYDAVENQVRLNFQSNVPTEGSVSLLLPESRRPEKLTVDGVERKIDTESIGQDVYVRISTDWRPHELRLQLN